MNKETTDRELMQQALEALELHAKQYPHMQKGYTVDAIAALRERLAQPEQEPVALETIYDTIICWDETDGKRSRRELARRIFALYTTPPRREWVGLTQEDWLALGCKTNEEIRVGLAIQAKLKEKNT